MYCNGLIKPLLLQRAFFPKFSVKYHSITFLMHISDSDNNLLGILNVMYLWLYPNVHYRVAVYVLSFRLTIKSIQANIYPTLCCTCLGQTKNIPFCKHTSLTSMSIIGHKTGNLVQINHTNCAIPNQSSRLPTPVCNSSKHALALLLHPRNIFHNIISSVHPSPKHSRFLVVK